MGELKQFVSMQGHLDEARVLGPQLHRQASSLLLPAVATDLYLKALEKQNFNVFAPELQNGGFSPLWYQLQLKYKMLRGQF